MSYWECDEAAAFDYLAILEIKMDKFPNNETVKQSYKNCCNNIKQELEKRNGLLIVPGSFYDIISSEEYKELKYANILTFDAVEKARYGKEEDITAKEVDDCNIKRYEAKKTLQKNFFGQELKEFKN